MNNKSLVPVRQNRANTVKVIAFTFLADTVRVSAYDSLGDKIFRSDLDKGLAQSYLSALFQLAKFELKLP